MSANYLSVDFRQMVSTKFLALYLSLDSLMSEMSLSQQVFFGSISDA